MKDEGGRMRDERASAGASYVSEQAVKQRIRGTAIWSAVAAGLMLYYTYSGGGWDKSKIESISVWMFVLTLELGGWAMALSTLLLLTGIRPALAFDAVASAVIGLFLLASGLLMFSLGGLQPVLNVVFGVIFIGAGRRSWQEHQLLRAPSRIEPEWRQAVASPTGQDARAEQAPDAPTDSLASRLRQRTQQAPQEPPPPSPPVPESAPPPAPEPPPPAPEPPSEPTADTTSKADPAPDGFLAQFADEHDERNREG